MSTLLQLGFWQWIGLLWLVGMLLFTVRFLVRGRDAEPRVTA
jgi:hypothetical protein